MAIQFRCPQCSKAIEVDDAYAGREALCPFCDRVVPVPRESTLSPEPPQPPPARPLEPRAQAQLPPELLDLAPAETMARQMAARSFARYAVVSAILCYVLFLSVMGYGCVLSVRALMSMSSGGTAPTTQQVQQELMQRLQNSPWVAAAQLGATFFALVGTLLAVVSLRQQSSGNWPAVLSAVGCGLYLTCTCGSIAFAMMAGAPG